MILPYNDHTPVLGQNVFVAPDATVIGRVTLGDQSSVWFQTVIRGDVHWITVGARSNIQDRCVIHVTSGKHPTVIGDDSTIGHSVTLHGCTIGDRCLIGIGAVILDEAVIGEGSLVAAGALVTPRTVIPPYSLVMGSPARVKRSLTDAERERYGTHSRSYVSLAATYIAQAINGLSR